jgi:hypothetical protein
MEEKTKKQKNNVWGFVKKALIFILPMILKNQKGIKGTNNEGLIDDVSNSLKQ